MEYSSLFFIYIFFPVSLLIYHVMPQKFKDIALLLMSMAFCSFFGLSYLLLIICFVVINFTAARLIGILKSKDGKFQTIPFAAAVLFDVIFIFVFRTEYFSWITHAFRLPDAFFPVGVSIYTLSAIGYISDVYRDKLKPEKNFVRFSLYIMMFPRLLMGPIMRYDIFLRALKVRSVSWHKTGVGLTIFIKGLAKKVIAADTLYAVYSAVSSTDVNKLSVVSAWIGAAAYLLCLYFTLSGIADMGSGVCYCFGLCFPQSFNYPVFSSRIRYFAAKWHIQVIHWFRKYITRPLCARSGSRYVRKLIFIGSWALAGFWYGFSPCSAVWGLLMGTSIILENKLNSRKTMKTTGILYTFLLTTVFFVFLSSGSISYALRYILAMIGGNRLLFDDLAIYLLRSYLVVLLITMYASADLFRNMLLRTGKTRIKSIIYAAAPIVLTLLLAVCTALLTYTGSTGNMLIRL